MIEGGGGESKLLKVPQGFQTKPHPGPEINHPPKPHVVPVIST